MLLPVRLSSVTFMHRTQSVEIFGNVSTSFGTLAIKILQRLSQGNPPSEELNTRGVAKYGDFEHMECFLTDRKSYMSFRLVPKSVTLNDLERRNGPYFALFPVSYTHLTLPTILRV